MTSRARHNKEIKWNYIQYVGVSGSSVDCRDAVLRIIQFGDRIDEVKILTSERRQIASEYVDRSHCLILIVNDYNCFAVKCGFTSGYNGEGPKTFSYILNLLETHGAEIDEYIVKSSVIERLDKSSLRQSDVDRLNEAKPIRPVRWRNYVLERYLRKNEADRIWSVFPHVIPFSIIDTRIADLAIQFWSGPDDALLKGYRRLEEIVRSRCEIDGASAAKLFSEAFNPQKGKLVWNDVDQSEQIGRMNLFISAFSAYRNIRAHKEKKETAQELLSEFLLLNVLFRLENMAQKR